MAVQIVLLPDPYVLDWQPWADTVVGYNPGLIEEVNPDADWPDFAQRFCQAVPGAPEPDGHATWRSWALALKQALAV